MTPWHVRYTTKVCQVCIIFTRHRRTKMSLKEWCYAAPPMAIFYFLSRNAMSTGKLKNMMFKVSHIRGWTPPKKTKKTKKTKHKNHKLRGSNSEFVATGNYVEWGENQHRIIIIISYTLTCEQRMVQNRYIHGCYSLVKFALRQFARARTIDECDFAMPVPRFRVTSQINCGDATKRNQKRPSLATMAKWAIGGCFNGIVCSVHAIGCKK